MADIREQVKQDYLRTAINRAREHEAKTGEQLNYIDLAASALRRADEKLARSSDSVMSQILNVGSMEYEKQKNTIFNDAEKHGGVNTLQQMHQRHTQPLRQAGMLRPENMLEGAAYEGHSPELKDFSRRRQATYPDLYAPLQNNLGQMEKEIDDTINSVMGEDRRETTREEPDAYRPESPALEHRDVLSRIDEMINEADSVIQGRSRGMTPTRHQDPAGFTPTQAEPGTEPMGTLEYTAKWIGGELKRGLWAVNEAMYRGLKANFEYMGNPLGYYANVGKWLIDEFTHIDTGDSFDHWVLQRTMEAPEWIDRNLEKYSTPEETLPEFALEASAEEERVRQEAYDNNYLLGLTVDGANMGSRVLLMLIQAALLNKAGAVATYKQLMPRSIPAPKTPTYAPKGIKGWPKALFEKLKGGIKETGQMSPQAYQQQIARLQRMGVHGAATTPGELEDRVEAAAYRIAYNITPVIANATGATGLTAIGTDILLNTILTSPVYMQAFDEHGFSPDFWAVAVPQMVMDVFMARGTRGLMGAQQQRAYAQRVENTAQKFGVKPQEVHKYYQDLSKTIDSLEKDQGVKFEDDIDRVFPAGGAVGREDVNLQREARGMVPEGAKDIRDRVLTETRDTTVAQRVSEVLGGFKSFDEVQRAVQDNIEKDPARASAIKTAVIEAQRNPAVLDQLSPGLKDDLSKMPVIQEAWFRTVPVTDMAARPQRETVLYDRGNTGKVVREGDWVLKNTVNKAGQPTEELNMLRELQGVEGVPEVRVQGDKFAIPYYDRVISVDTVAKGDREQYRDLVSQNQERINNILNELTRRGISYSDELQFGVDSEGRFNLIDFSNAQKVSVGEARESNRSYLTRFMEQFRPVEGETHTYYLTQRPPAPGAIPKGAVDVVSYDQRDDTGIWGHVTYSKPLTDQQVKDYELMPDRDLDVRIFGEARDEPRPSIPDYVQRIEEPGRTPDITKPHGLYTTPADHRSPHEDMSGDRHVWQVNKDANILQARFPGEEVAMREGAIGAGAGVHAARELLGKGEFGRLKALPFNKLIKEASTKVPGVDFGRYYDKQEIMEALGAQLAMKQGYDAIYTDDPITPAFNEYVVLTRDALREYTPKAKGDKFLPPTKEAPTAPTDTRVMLTKAPEPIKKLSETIRDNPHLSDVKYEYRDTSLTRDFTREELDKNGYQDKEPGTYEVTGYRKNLPDGTREVVLGRGSSKDTVLEETTHVLYDKLEKLDPNLYRDIQAWEDAVIAKADKQGLNAPSKGELFARAYTFAEMGYAKEDPELAKLISIPKRLVNNFNKYLGESSKGEDALSKWRGVDTPKTAPEKRKLSVEEPPLKLKTIPKATLTKLTNRYFNAYEKAFNEKPNKTEELAALRNAVSYHGEEKAIADFKRVVQDFERKAEEERMTPLQRKAKELADKVVNPNQLKSVLKEHKAKTVADLKPKQAEKVYETLKEKAVDAVAKDLRNVAMDMAKGEGADIVQRIRQHAKGVAPHKDKTTGERVETEEYRELPQFIRRSVEKGGMPADELASALGMSESKLMQELRLATGKGSMRIEDFRDEAKKIVDSNDYMLQLKRVDGGKTPETRQKINSAMHAIAKEQGLDRDARLKKAQDYLNNPNLKSTKDMSDKELRGFVDYLKQQQDKADAEMFKAEYPDLEKRYGDRIDEAMGVNKGYWDSLYETIPPAQAREAGRIEMEAQKDFSRAEAAKALYEKGRFNLYTISHKELDKIVTDYTKQFNRMSPDNPISKKEAMANFARLYGVKGEKEAVNTFKEFIRKGNTPKYKPLPGGRIGMAQDIERSPQLGWVEEKADRRALEDYAKSLGLKTQQEIDKVIAENEILGHRLGKVFVPASRGMTQEDFKRMTGEEPGPYEKKLASLWRGLPEDMYNDAVAAKLLIKNMVDKYQPILDESLRGLTDTQKEKVADILDGKPGAGMEARIAKNIRNRFLDPLFSEAVKAGILEEGQYVVDYFSRIQDFSSKKSKRDSLVSKPWFQHERTGALQEYSKDAYGVLTAYLNTLAKNTHLRPVLDKWDPLVRDMPEARQDMAKQLFQAASGRPQENVRGYAKTFQKAMDVIGIKIDDQTAIGHVQEFSRLFVGFQVQRTMGLGVGTALRNTTQKILAIADVGGKSNPLRGLRYWGEYRPFLASAEGREFINKYCTLLNERQAYDEVQRVAEYQWRVNKMLDKTGKYTMALFKAADIDNVRFSFYAGYRAAIDDGKSQLEAIQHGNNVARRTQYDYSIGRPAIYHDPGGRLVGVFSSWATNYASLLGDWHREAGGGVKGTLNTKFATQVAISGLVSMITRGAGFAFRIMPPSLLSGHLLKRLYDGDIGIMRSTLDDTKQIVERIVSFDLEEWGKAAQEAVYAYLPMGAFLKRLSKVYTALSNDGKVRDHKGKVLYTLDGFSDYFYELAGHSRNAANRWELINRHINYKTETEYDTKGRSIFKTHHAYETALHASINPDMKAKLTAQAAYLATRGMGYEVADLFKSPNEQVKILEQRIKDVGLDPEDAKKTAMSNVRGYYSDRMVISVRKGKSGWQSDFKYNLHYFEKAEGNTDSGTRKPYYRAVADAINNQEWEEARRWKWVLVNQFGIAPQHLIDTLQNGTAAGRPALTEQQLRQVF